MKSRMKQRGPVLYALICLTLLGGTSLLGACSIDTPSTASSGASGNVTMREVVGDFCPPAQATKGNC